METIQKPRITLDETPTQLIGAMLNGEKYLKQSGLSSTLMELIKTRASQINKCGYCLDMHHKDALKAGEEFQRLYLLPAWEESPCFTNAEKAVLNLTDTLTTISEANAATIEAAYERVGAYYSTEEVANIVFAICQINSWNRISILFGTVPGSYTG